MMRTELIIHMGVSFQPYKILVFPIFIPQVSQISTNKLFPQSYPHSLNLSTRVEKKIVLIHNHSVEKYTMETL